MKTVDDSSVRLLSPSGTIVSVDKAILSRLGASDVLIPSPGGDVLILGAAEREAVGASVARSLAAFRDMLSVTDDQIVAFFGHAFSVRRFDPFRNAALPLKVSFSPKVGQ